MENLDVNSNPKKRWLDDSLHGGTLLIHLGTIISVFVHFIPELEDETLFFVFYVIILTGFWIIYIYKKYSEHKKDYMDRSALHKTINDKLTEENIVLTEKLNKANLLTRKAQYAEALIHINNGFAHINDGCRHHIQHVETKTEELDACILKLMEEFGRYCSDVERAFTMITGFNSSVCIKLFANEDPTNKANCSVYTLKRDNIGEQNRKHPKEKDVKHWIKNNTSYSSILKNIGHPNGRNFFSNNLPFNPRYTSTSFEVWGDTKADHTMSQKQILDVWPLPYKSTIVTAICPNLAEQFKEEMLLGFLCVDCNELDAFDENYDTMLMVGNSDGIYNSVKLLLELLKRNKNHSSTLTSKN